MSAYKHQPLAAPRNIRILQIEAASTTSTELKTVLAEVSLDDDPVPKYSALSYCWEGQTPSCPIQCAGSILQVTKNCWSAMIKLRSSEDTVSVWIDSICINQTDVEEKNIQVALMGDIYKTADKVIVWLGEWDDSLRKAVNTIKHIATIESFENTTWDEDEKKDALRMQQLAHQRARSLKTATRSSSDDVLGALYNRPWFSRMWTVQEVALAHGINVVIYNGPDPSDQLSWPILICATDALLVCQYEWIDLSKTVKLHKHLVMMVNMARYPALKEIYAAKPGDLVQEPLFWPIMCDAREKDATDARDKVFAMYSVFQELKIGTMLPLPDYSKPVEDVFRELTIASIKSDKNLYVLFDAPSDHRHHRPRLASWVPDWSDPGWRGKRNIDSRLPRTRSRFCAALSQHPSWEFRANDHQLVLEGKIVDEIVLLGEPLCCLDFKNSTTRVNRPQSDALEPSTNVGFKREIVEAYNTLQSWVEVSKWYERYPMTGEGPGYALHRTLMQDYLPKDNDDQRRHLNAFNTWFKLMRSPNSGVEIIRSKYAIQLGDQKHDDAFVENVIQQLPAGSVPLAAEGLDQYRMFKYKAVAFSNLRGFFVTKEGKIGTAPARVEKCSGEQAKAKNLVRPGDQIAVIAGLEMPVILRPVDTDKDQHLGNVSHERRRAYQLVTHAYVHGIMYGQAWVDGGIPIQEIVLV